jgi:hypothetical protein
MFNANIDIFEMSFEETFFLFQVFGELLEDQAHQLLYVERTIAIYDQF